MTVFCLKPSRKCQHPLPGPERRLGNNRTGSRWFAQKSLGVVLKTAGVDVIRKAVKCVASGNLAGAPLIWPLWCVT